MILLLASCQNKDKKILSSSQQLNEFTNKLLSKVTANKDLIAGVKEAQKYLEANKKRMHQNMEVTKTTNRVQVSEKTMKIWHKAVESNLSKIETLRNTHVRDALANQDLAQQLDKLIKEYRDLLQK